MGQRAINRRQFMVRGGATAMAVGLFAGLPAAARAAGVLDAEEAGTSMTASELNVITGLVGAICLANGRRYEDAEELGLQTPAAFSAAYAQCDSETRAAISSVLQVVESAPASGLFSVLGGYGQAEFIGGTFAELEIYEASDQDVAVLDALANSTNALLGSLHSTLSATVTGSTSQPVVPAPKPAPFTGSENAQYVFSQTLLCGLSLVSEPLYPDTAPEIPSLSAGTAAALSEWLAHRAANSKPPRHLVAAITSELAVPLVDQVEHRVLPCVALSRALTIWMGLAAERISL